MRILSHLLLTTLSILLIPYIVPGVFISSLYTAFILAIVFTIMNILIRPILLFITLPINILTFGLFTLILNGALFWFASSFVKGFAVSGFWVAVLGALVLSVLNWIADRIIKK